MKILHTSDWHIGRCLYGRKRIQEYEAFFDWLLACLRVERIEALLVAGDIFDTGTPSNQAQELYYRFLCRVAATGCRHVVVVAGNHDSPSLLNAPREVLRRLRVHVVGSVTEEVADELVVLDDAEGRPQVIVCAVPYLRDRDIRRAEAGESLEDKGRKLIEGIGEHYRLVAEAALAQAAALGGGLPIVGMGHLFASGGRTVEGDGVRELYVGNLGQVRAETFPDCLAYLALGHLHGAQRLRGQAPSPAAEGQEARPGRYSGAPLPMSFAEAGQGKVVLVVKVDACQVTVEERAVPCCQRLVSVCGDWAEISARLSALAAEDCSIWLEVLYQGAEVLADLPGQVQALIRGTQLECLRVKDLRLAERTLSRSTPEETLDDLQVEEVFGRLLLAHQVPLEQQAELIALFEETVLAVVAAQGGEGA